MNKVLSTVCKCLNKVLCMCLDFWAMPSKNRHLQISERDLQEWKRIEGIDQFHRKRP